MLEIAFYLVFNPWTFVTLSIRNMRDLELKKDIKCYSKIYFFSYIQKIGKERKI